MRAFSFVAGREINLRPGWGALQVAPRTTTNTQEAKDMLHPVDLDPHIQALLSKIPDVPVMMAPGQAETVLSSEDPTLIAGLPLAWFSSTDGQHDIKVNRLLVGLHLAKAGAVPDARDIGRATRHACSELIRQLMKKLQDIDPDAVVINEHEAEAPKASTIVARMDLLNAAANRLNTAPRYLVARILGRTLH